MFTGVGDNDEVVDISEYSQTTRSCYKKLQASSCAVNFYA